MKQNNIDLGTLISAEMYSYSNQKEKKKEKLNKNTFQQSTDLAGPTDENVLAPAPVFLTGASHPRARENQEDQGVGITEPKYGRRLNHRDDKIVEMHLQIGHVKLGDRHSRVKAYLSIKTETDNRYMIFMRSALTSALDETFRSIRKDCDKVLESEASNIYAEHHNQGLFMGRVKYKPVKGNKILKHHRKNLPLSLISAWIQDGYWHVDFYLLDRSYTFVLNEELSEKQKVHYSAQGTWYDDECPTLSIEEAFGG